VSGKLGRIFAPLTRASAPASTVIVLIHDSFNPQMAAGAEAGMREALSESGFTLSVHALDRKVADRVAAIRAIVEEERPLGAVLLPPSADDDAIAEACREAGCRPVRLAAAPVGDPAHCLSAGDRAGARAATELLIAQGHGRIGFIAGPDGDLSARERELGFMDAMAEHGLDRGAMLVAAGDWSFESGVSAGRLLLDVSPRPTAVLASNDGMAVGVLQAAREAKLPVPAALSIVGFGDTPIATRLDPELTSVHVPAWEMGFTAAAMLTGGDPGTRSFACELVVRGSSGPAAR
jgi:LacI family transcriptional regulator